MITAASPWTTQDHDGPAKGRDTDKDTTTDDDAPTTAPVNPLLIGEGRQLPKGGRRG